MKLTIILSSNNAETNWNAFRLANLAISKGDSVSIFLIGEGVEYEKNNSSQFNIEEQLTTFFESKTARIIACETCMKTRNQKESKQCPAGGIADLYQLVVESDKVISF